MKDRLKPSENTLYIQLWEKRIRVTDIGSGNIFDEAPLLAVEGSGRRRKVVAFGNRASSVPGREVVVIHPFTHPRSLLADPQSGQWVLQGIFAKMLGGGALSSFAPLSPSPLVVIQPMEKNKGGLTGLEVQGFQDMCLGAGARRVMVYQGPELTRHTFDLEKIKAGSVNPDAARKGRGSSLMQWIWIAIWFAIIAASMLFQRS